MKRADMALRFLDAALPPACLKLLRLVQLANKRCQLLGDRAGVFRNTEVSAQIKACIFIQVAANLLSLRPLRSGCA